MKIIHIATCSTIHRNNIWICAACMLENTYVYLKLKTYHFSMRVAWFSYNSKMCRFWYQRFAYLRKKYVCNDIIRILSIQSILRFLTSSLHLHIFTKNIKNISFLIVSIPFCRFLVCMKELIISGYKLLRALKNSENPPEITHLKHSIIDLAYYKNQQNTENTSIINVDI